MIAIKDMKMPKCCRNCPLQMSMMGCSFYCGISFFHVDYYSDKRDPKCPLIEVEVK